MLDKILALFGKCGQLPQKHKETDVLKNSFILDPYVTTKAVHYFFDIP